MADVFVSYAREEQPRAEIARKALEALGLSVFFDVERLDAGDVWSDVVDRELKSAGAVVALWSPHALSRPWVKKECAIAQSRGVLLPALIEPVGDLDMPAQFFDLQRVDLTDFHGQPDHAGWRKLVRALAKTLKRNDLLAAQIAALKEEKQTAKVKADLEAAQKELAQLRKSRGGVRPQWIAAGLILMLVIGGATTWWAVGAAKRSLVDPEVVNALSAIPAGAMGTENSKQMLARVFEKVSLPRLVEASTVDADAALLAGWAYEFGEGGVATNPADAVRFFDRSCRLGNMRGCSSLGLMYANGTGVAKDYPKAVDFFRKACDGGYAGDCVNLGFMYADGTGIARDEAKAVDLYRKTCDGGVATGCTSLGIMYANGTGVARDEAKAKEYYVKSLGLYRKACDGGEAGACAALGQLYLDGTGVAKEEAKASDLLRKACDGGDAFGCFTLGTQYLVGIGVTKDAAKAVDLYRKACDEQPATACYELGRIYAEGDSIVKDEAKAADVYRKACYDGGVAKACDDLGVMNIRGTGVAKDYPKAVDLFRKACDWGYARGCSRLGLVYREGTGVTKDEAKAQDYLAKACKAGDEAACDL